MRLLVPFTEQRRSFKKGTQMRTFLIFLSAIVLNGCGATPDQAAPRPAEHEPPFKPIADVRQLMTAIIIPTSDVVFQVGSNLPQDDKAWTAVDNAALALAESGNLLMLGDRAKRETSWMEFSRAMIDAAETAMKAAQKKNVDEVLAAGDKVYATCENCHNQYMDKTGRSN